MLTVQIPDHEYCERHTFRGDDDFAVALVVVLDRVVRALKAELDKTRERS